MVALYFDEDADQRVAREHRRLGYDVVTAFDNGRANGGVSDADVLRRATALGRVVVTCNRSDYKRLHIATAGEHRGIITLSQRVPPLVMANRLHRRLAALEDLTGRILHVYQQD